VVEALPARSQEAVVGMSRGQFLKGVGGVAIAASVFAGMPLMPGLASKAAAAEANPGTSAQQTLIRQIVRNSSGYKTLANMQSAIGTSFVFTQAKYNVRAPLAALSVPSPSKVRGIAALFFVNLNTKLVLSYHPSMIHKRTNGTLKHTRYLDGRVPNVPYHQQVIGDDFVVTQDNRIISHDKYRAEINALNQQQGTASRAAFATDPNQACKDRNGAFCGITLPVMSLGAGTGTAAAGAVIAGSVVGVIPGAIIGLVGIGATYLACERLEAACDQQYPQQPPAVNPQPVKYYC
jgi:hypothetical protein